MPEPAKLLFGSSPSVRAMLRDAELYARTSYPILILGESGVGKTALAELIHIRSGRPGPFVKQGMSWIPRHLEAAHLAGHAKGAFTGATEARAGQIESAHGGTFFLDELGLASATVQQLLLQLLEDRAIRRVGEVRDRPVDVRFIAATNADLDELVSAGRFRADLLHRFGYLTLRVPALADRKDEILTLANAAVLREAEALHLPSPPCLSRAVQDYLVAAPWPGNIRELEAVCRYAVLHAPADGTIELCDLPADFVAPLGEVMQHNQRTGGQSERAQAALARAGGNKAKAARLLGCTRQQLYRMLGTVASAIILASAVGRPPYTCHLSHRTHRPPVTRSTTRVRQAP